MIVRLMYRGDRYCLFQVGRDCWVAIQKGQVLFVQGRS